MFEAEVLKQLRDRYGTDKPCNCNKCKLKHSRSNMYFNMSKLICGKASCEIITTGHLISILEEGKNGSMDKDVINIYSKLAKAKVLGCAEHIEPPWVILESLSGRQEKSWINPKTKIACNKWYDNILFKGEMLICSNGDMQAVCKNISIFSIYTGSKNLLDGIANTFYEQSRFEVFANNDGFITCGTVDEAGRKFSLIVSKYGDRLILPYDNKIYRQSINGTVNINFSNNHALVVVDDRLNILKKRNVPFAMNI